MTEGLQGPSARAIQVGTPDPLPSDDLEVPVGPHWFLQESEERGGRYLKIFANSMVEVNGRLSFQDINGVELIAFEPHEWKFTENGTE